MNSEVDGKPHTVSTQPEDTQAEQKPTEVRGRRSHIAGVPRAGPNDRACSRMPARADADPDPVGDRVVRMCFLGEMQGRGEKG